MRYTSDTSQKAIKYTLMKIIEKIMKDIRIIEESHLDQYCSNLTATLPQKINSMGFALQSANLISNDMTLSFHLNTQSQYRKEIENLKSELQDEIKSIYLKKLKCEPTVNQISQEKLALLLKEIKTMEFENEKKQRSIMEYLEKQRISRANQDGNLTPTVINKPRPSFSLSA